MSFSEVFAKYSWDELGAKIYGCRSKDVERALNRSGHGSVEDFFALISPAATPYLGDMAEISHALTQKRFGKVIQMYIPLYLSNECHNVCTYCGFSFTNKIERKTLSPDEILVEAKVLKEFGYDNLLVVTGESSKRVGMNYFKVALEVLKPLFSQITFEVQPLLQYEYEELFKLGVSGVLVYQETYNQKVYNKFHPKGKKSNFEFRLQTPDRLGRAGARKIGLGALLGLQDWRVDSAFVALHLNYLERAFWRTRYSVSFPRIRPAEGVNFYPTSISDREFVQLVCAYRIWNENLELSLSTRESKKIRDGIIPLGINSISAGSSTEPGGYSQGRRALKQFEIDDNRSPIEMAEAIRAMGYDPVWKDWDHVFG